MGKAWVKARRHDRFYRAAKKQAYRSRAAIKLSQIDRRYGLFHEGAVVVDLGAAPGGWSQVARERVGPKGREIGRASCRERVWSAVGAGARNRKSVGAAGG